MKNKNYNEIDKSISCSVQSICGSCQYTEIPYEKQLEQKTKTVKQLFSGICDVEPVVGMYRPIYYRNKVHVVVGRDKNKKLITGNYMQGSHQLVPVEHCMIDDQKAGMIISTLRDLFESFKYEPYDEDQKIGFIRHILIRRGFSTNEIMVVLVTAQETFPSKNNFVKVLLERHPEITTIVQNINGMSTSMILGNKSKVLYGDGYIEDVLCGCRFRISPESFYQINPAQTEKLYKTAIRLADIKKNDTVIDAYCGIGTIGIAASSNAGKVIGVELNPKAVKDAQENATRNQIRNIKFVCGDAGQFLINYAKQSKADVVIMDPPREGASEEFVDALLTIMPDRIVYISCNPQTQVRDVKKLLKKGYTITACKPFDMFAHTEHVENVILLQRKDT